ncbi:hypothetical protein Tco_1144540 [Tanacetum coccineum]
MTLWGGSFHVSPPRFTQASPTSHASGGAEDHITLSALSSAVSTLVKKVHSLENELKAHKKLFKDVVPKLVKKVKALEMAQDFWMTDDQRKRQAGEKEIVGNEQRMEGSAYGTSFKKSLLKMRRAGCIHKGFRKDDGTFPESRRCSCSQGCFTEEVDAPYHSLDIPIKDKEKFLIKNLQQWTVPKAQSNCNLHQEKGDLQILMDSPEVNDGSDFWKNQHTWSIQSWKLYSFSSVLVLETVSGLVIHMFVDKKYPLSINLIERMLDHQLEIAVQLIAFLKKQISNSKRPKVHEWYVVPTGRVVDSTGRYVVPAGKVIIIVSPGRQNLVPTGRILSPGLKPHLALLRNKLKEVWSTICYEDEIFQDFLNTSESSNDKTNVVNAPQEPFVFNQDPGENSSQRPLHIDHHCCYGCGTSLKGIFCQRCTCESCGKGAHYGYNCPLKVLTISNSEPCHNQNVDEFPHTLPSFHPTCYSGYGSSFTYDSTPNFVDDSPNIFNPPSKPPTYSCEFCGNDAHYGYNFPPQPSQCRKIPICYDDDDDEYSFATQEYLEKFSSAITPDLPKSDSLIMEDKHLDTIPAPESDELIKSSVEDLIHTPSESDGISESECDFPVCDYSSSKKDKVLDDIISILPGNGNDHFNAEYSLIESMLNRDNVISSPKIDFLLEEFTSELALIAPIPSGIVEADFDPKGDIRFIENLMYDNSFPRPPETLKDDSETVIDSNNDYSSSDNDSLYSDDIDYVEASPPDSELVRLEVVEIVIPEVGRIDTDILLTIKDDILREKLLNVNLLIAKIEALKDNPTPSSDFVTKSSSTSLNFFLEETNTFDNSLPESETFCFNLEEISSGSPTSYLDLSLPDYEAFFCDSEPDSGNFTMDVVEDIFDNPTREPRVHVPNVLPTHPTLQLDSDFTLSSDSLGSDLVVSFPSGTRNKIFDPGIFIEVQSKRFLSPNEFSISFIRDPLSPVFDTLLPFSSENEDNVFNPGILASNEEKSPHLLSHRGFKAFQLISESPMMISGGDIPILDVQIKREASKIFSSKGRFFSLGFLEIKGS